MSIETEILALKEKHGMLLKAEHIVEWAKDNENSLLYGSLEWNDERAGHEFRLSQARRLIAIHIINNDTGIRKLISLSIDRKADGGGYRSLEDIRSTPQLREIYLADALAELQRVERKYQAIEKELAPVWRAVARVKRKSSPEEKRAAS